VKPTIVPLMDLMEDLVVDFIVNYVREPVLDIVAWSQLEPKFKLR